MAPTWSFQCGVPPSGATGPYVVPPRPCVVSQKPLRDTFSGPYVVFPMPSTWCPPGRLRGLSHALGPSVVSPKPLRGPYVVSPDPLRGTFPWPVSGVAFIRGFSHGPYVVPPWPCVVSPKPLRGTFPWPPCWCPRGLSHGFYVEPQKPLRGTFPRPLYMVSHRGAIGAMGDTT